MIGWGVVFGRNLAKIYSTGYIFLCNVSRECCSFAKSFLSLYHQADSLVFTYESVFAVLLRKCGSFHGKKATNSTHFLYMSESSNPFRGCASRYTGVGHCIVYSCLGLSTTFLEINGIHLHTFFLYTRTYRIGDATVIISINSNEKITSFGSVSTAIIRNSIGTKCECKIQW